MDVVTFEIENKNKIIEVELDCNTKLIKLQTLTTQERKEVMPKYFVYGERDETEQFPFANISLYANNWFKQFEKEEKELAELRKSKQESDELIKSEEYQNFLKLKEAYDKEQTKKNVDVSIQQLSKKLDESRIYLQLWKKTLEELEKVGITEEQLKKMALEPEEVEEKTE